MRGVEERQEERVPEVLAANLNNNQTQCLEVAQFL